MKGLRLAVSMLVLAVLVSSCLSCGQPSFSKETREAIESAVDRVMSGNDIPGAIVGVKVPGEGELVLAKGKADISTGKDISASDKVRIGSITKTFTVTIILQLVDEGRIGLDDKLDKYFPEIQDSGNITIRELCNMTSGLFDYTADEGLQKTLGENPGTKWKPRELVEIAVSHDPYFPPGEGFYYSNTNIVVLGMIVEQLTGNKLAEEIESRIIKKLGLENTVFPVERTITGKHSHGYMFDDENELQDVTNYLDPSLPWAAGAMISDLDALETWAVALADGKLLSEATQAQRLTWVDGEISDDKFEYGLGVANVKGFIGHAGDIPGYSSAMFYNPKIDATVVVFLNKDPNKIDFAGLSLFMDIADIILRSQQ